MNTLENIINGNKIGGFNFLFKYIPPKKSIKSSIVKVSEIFHEGYEGEFTITCEETYGYTIANSLRRILLSDINGMAPVAISIKNATHEFTTIPGMKETVLNFLIKIRQLRIRTKEDFVILQLKKTGSGPVTTEHLSLVDGVSIINEVTFCHLEGKNSFEAQIAFAKSYGFVRAECHEFSPKIPTNFFTIDSCFSPIKNCSYTVHTSTSGSIKSDIITIKISTDGQITPEEALNEAIAKNINILNALCPNNQEQEEPLSEDYINDTFLNTAIKDITELSVRAKNCLLSNEIDFIKNLVTKTPEQLSSLSGFGQVSLDEVQDYLNKNGLQLGMKIKGGIK